jgi:DNA repair ATPase RecN
VDEIDAHLHPAWQQILVERLSTMFPAAQFIVTTHSPLIVAGMPTSQVQRFARDANGVVEVVPIDEEMMLGRTDQILTSDLFNLDTTLDAETRAAEAEYRTLLGRKRRNEQEERRIREVEDILRFRIPPTGETPLERQASELLRLLLERHALGEHAAAREEIVAAGEKLLTTLAKRRARGGNGKTPA